MNTSSSVLSCLNKTHPIFDRTAVDDVVEQLLLQLDNSTRPLDECEFVTLDGCVVYRDDPCGRLVLVDGPPYNPGEQRPATSMDGFWLPSGNYTFLGLLAVEEQDGEIVEWETCRFDTSVPKSCGAADSIIYSESMWVAGVLGGISALCVFVSLVFYVVKTRRKRHAKNSAPIVSSGSNDERDEYHQQASV